MYLFFYHSKFYASKEEGFVFVRNNLIGNTRIVYRTLIFSFKIIVLVVFKFKKEIKVLKITNKC